MELEKTLEGLGFTRNEIKTYLALLSIGSTTTGEIIKTSNLHVPRVYEALERLITKGLVSFVVKNNVKYFEAAPPEMFLDILEERKKEMKKILPLLIARKKSAEKRPEVATIYHGIRGIRTVCNSILHELKRGGEYLDFGVSGAFREVVGAYWDVWQKTKKEWKISSKCLFDEKLRHSDLHKDYFGEARFIPTKFHCPSDTMIFNDKIVVFAWNALPPTVVVIRDKTTAQGYKNIFKWMWFMASE